MNLSIMIKPASSKCNLECKYCFYNSLSSTRVIVDNGIMSESTLYKILEESFNYVKNDTLSISFQGGEPLLAGKDFFKNFNILIKKLNANRASVLIGLQTNGLMIDEDWCNIFKEGNFLIGLSLDGNKVTNYLRVDKNGKDTFDRILVSAKLLEKNKIDFNILTVLTKKLVENIETVYEFYKKQNFKYLQFIPMLKPLKLDKEGNVINELNLDPYPNILEDYSLSKEDYKVFLFKCFELYKNDYIKGDYTSIRLFDNFVLLAHNIEAEQCGLMGHCNRQFVFESNGDVYPCDFYCLDNYKIGNINDNNLLDMFKNELGIKFIEESLSVEEKCKKCRFYKLCFNGCKRERIDIIKCESHQEFFNKYIQDLKNMN